MRLELIGAIMLAVCLGMLVVLRPRQGVPVQLIQRASGNAQAAIGLVFTTFLFIGVGLILTGLF